MTDLNRVRHGRSAAAEKFLVDGELVPLTEVFEDLEVHRLVLGEQFHDVLSRMARLALRAAQPSPATGAGPSDGADVVSDWAEARADLRAASETTFGISEITF